MAILIGGFIGFILAGFPGLLLGVFIGAIISKIDFAPLGEEMNGNSVLLRTLPLLCAWLTLGTGNSKSMVIATKQFAISTFGTHRAKIFMDNFKLQIESNIQYDKIRIAAQELNFSLSMQSKYSLIQIFISLITGRADYKDSDLNSIKEIADLIGIPLNFQSRNRYNYNSYNSYNSNFIQKDETTAYKILESEESDSFDEIKKNYRKLSMKYHPDRNAQLTDEERLVSETKMREINDAYDRIKTARNVK